MRMLTAALIALATTALPSIALADYSYTFRIPVTVTNVDSDKLIQTECDLYDGKNATGNWLTTNTSATATSTNRSYSGTMTVHVSSTKQPLSYECYVLVYSGGSTPINIAGVSHGAYTPINGWTGTQFMTANFTDLLAPKGALQSL